MEKKSRRFFIALPVEDETVINSLAVVNGFFSKYRSSLKIVPSDNYHLTLKFLGSIETGTADSVISSFRFSYPLKKVDYSIKGLGTFPSHGEPSVIWAGLECGKDPLDEIVESVDSFASSCGFIPDRRGLVPHLTLARVKTGRAVDGDVKKFISDEKHTLFSSSAFNELVLFESILKPEGAEYKKIKVIELI